MNTNDDNKTDPSRTQTQGGSQPSRDQQGNKQASAPGKSESDTDTAKRNAGSDSSNNAK